MKTTKPAFFRFIYDLLRGPKRFFAKHIQGNKIQFPYLWILLLLLHISIISLLLILSSQNLELGISDKIDELINRPLSSPFAFFRSLFYINIWVIAVFFCELLLMSIVFLLCGATLKIKEVLAIVIYANSALFFVYIIGLLLGTPLLFINKLTYEIFLISFTLIIYWSSYFYLLYVKYSGVVMLTNAPKKRARIVFRIMLLLSIIFIILFVSIFLIGIAFMGSI